MSNVFTDPELQMHLLSFMGIRDLWSMQLTSQSNRASVQGYLRSKFARYLTQVVTNTTSGKFQFSAAHATVLTLVHQVDVLRR